MLTSEQLFQFLPKNGIQAISKELRKEYETIRIALKKNKPSHDAVNKAHQIIFSEERVRLYGEMYRKGKEYLKTKSLTNSSN